MTEDIIGGGCSLERCKDATMGQKINRTKIPFTKLAPYSIYRLNYLSNWLPNLPKINCFQFGFMSLVIRAICMRIAWSTSLHSFSG